MFEIYIKPVVALALTRAALPRRCLLQAQRIYGEMNNVRNAHSLTGSPSPGPGVQRIVRLTKS